MDYILTIINIVLLGLLIPSWAMIPMFFGVNTETDVKLSEKIYALIFLFLIASISSLAYYWLNYAEDSFYILILPYVPIAWLLYLFKENNK